MVSTSKAATAKPETKSIKATIPEAICEFMGIQHGDTLQWEMQVRGDGKRVTMMSKA